MAQRQPTDAQIDAAKRILAHDHKRTYAMHSKGATIRAIQIYLASQGYEPGRFDGDWGAKTQAAWDALKADRGWTYTRATPKALADISKEMGQPLPRQRPAGAGQFIGGNGAEPAPAPVTMTGSADAMPAPPVGMDVSGSVDVPPPVGMTGSAEMMPAAPPNMDVSGSFDFEPQMSSASLAQPPAPSIDTTAIGSPERRDAQLQRTMDSGFDRGRFEEALPMTSDMGVPDQLVEAAKARQPGGPVSLREALAYPGSNMLPSPSYMSPQGDAFSQLGGAVQGFGKELVGAPAKADPLRAFLLQQIMAGR